MLMSRKRIERDSLGEVEVDIERLWGAQTQRSLENFPVGWEKMPLEIIRAFALLKKACASVNHELLPDRMSSEKSIAIMKVCDEILSGLHDSEFPLSVWQTGSGTQSNMNVNEVIANRGNNILGKRLLHPNDDVNMSQSSNDTFPSAMHIASCIILKNDVIPALQALCGSFRRLEEENEDVIKIGRTHLQDAVPLRFSQELSGYRGMLEEDLILLQNSIERTSKLAIGATAVGTGLNAPGSFGAKVCEKLTEYCGITFLEAPNKFQALTSLDRMVSAHASLKALAADLMKIANDIRFLSSGPRCGLGELKIPENEPGSSIMPGKVNPTQCESVTMVALEVMGSDASIGFAASQGNFELNVFLPLVAYNFIKSARLLSDSMASFNKRCVSGISADRRKMKENLEKSLMLVTALSPKIGYEKASEIAIKAHLEETTLREAAIALEYMTPDEFDDTVKPENFV